MDELQKNKEVISLEKKLRNETGGKEYVEKLREMTPFDLEEELKGLAKYRQAILTTKAKDIDLKTARKKVNGLTYPYTQQLKGNGEKARFIGLLLQEQEGFEPTREDIDLED